MQISSFMITADKVATCWPTDTIRVALAAMLEKKIGAIVVLRQHSKDMEPVGILTKTDFVDAYQKGLSLDTLVEEIMTKELQTLRDNMPRDSASKFFEDSKHHHAIVVNEKSHFVGIISTWDISAEAARDDRAWPWNRSADGRFHKPNETAAPMPGSPNSVRRESHTFLEYIDSIRDLGMMDD